MYKKIKTYVIPLTGWYMVGIKNSFFEENERVETSDEIVWIEGKKMIRLTELVEALKEESQP